ncbi:MAG TPA: hypothetical protein VFM53_06610 [Anaeromyxobacteraceae bacterium]|nr:hypothetical protein [Anaeromyxobacteraceae bacterium]
MSDVLESGVPDVFGPYWNGSGPSSPRPVEAARRRTPRPGQRCILLSAANPQGRSILLAFTRSRGGVDFWRSLSPERSALRHVRRFPGPFTARAVAGLLASGAARPAIDVELLASACVDGVGPDEADLLALAWFRDHDRVDARAAAVLALPRRVLEDARERTGLEGVAGLLELGERGLAFDREWVEEHAAEVDAEVDRRATGVGAGEQERRTLRAFVEGCLVALGRLPRPGETPGHWDGAGLAGRDLGRRELRRLGLLQTGRSGKFHVWVRYRSGADAVGRGDFGSGVGWYWDVTNPDPCWLVDGVMGPCRSASEAWSEAACLVEQE